MYNIVEMGQYCAASVYKLHAQRCKYGILEVKSNNEGIAKALVEKPKAEETSSRILKAKKMSQVLHSHVLVFSLNKLIIGASLGEPRPTM